MLTARQYQTYQFIARYMQQHHYAPTGAEIAAGIGIKSRGVVHRYLQALVAVGLIQTIPGCRRNIRLLKQLKQLKNEDCLPIVGKIAAGQPIEAIEHTQLFHVTKHLLGENRFMLEVKGDSMIGDNIIDGDYIVCEKKALSSQNDIVVALIDNEEATLKRIHYNQDGTVTLLPSNPRLSPTVYPADRITIQGVFIGLLRLT